MKAIGMPMKKKAKKGTKMTPSQEMAMKKAKKGTMGLVKGVKAFESQTKRRKSSKRYLNAIPAPALPQAAPRPSLSGMGPRALSNPVKAGATQIQSRLPQAQKKSKKRKGSNALVKNPKNTKMPKKSAKKASGLA